MVYIPYYNKTKKISIYLSFYGGSFTHVSIDISYLYTYSMCSLAN